jgi:orotate phosphoribosyltransferase-like protein
LLPGSPIETECAIEELVKEAKETLQDLLTPTEKYEKLRELNVSRETMSAIVLTRGVMLGKTLESMRNQKTRWDLLAEFWAEMLVYIAPSDNVTAHIELLAEGGEFVTHIWALLMHAGILERPAAAVP